MNRKWLSTQYVDLVQDDFVSYWNRSYDEEKGGILNCINNEGDQRLSDNKFTRSEGRCLWTLGRLYELKQQGTLPKLDGGGLLRQVRGTYGLLAQHSIYGDNIYYYLLDRDRNKPEDKRTEQYDASISADCFTLTGMAQYIRAARLKGNLTAVEALYEGIAARIENGEFLTEPHPIPEGYRVHSVPMIMADTTYEYIKMHERFDLPCEQQIAYGLGKVRSTLGDLYRSGYTQGHVSTDENYEIRLLDRHTNPGHTLEDMWFCMRPPENYGDLPAYLPRILELARNAFDIGWDPKYDGLLRLIDRTGGTPKGISGDGDPERLIQDTWDMKLWWSCSEVLCASPCLYSLSGKRDPLERCGKASAHVFSTFPSKGLEEWIQIRKHDGTPEEKLVTLPVKDPFHILRDFVKIVELYW